MIGPFPSVFTSVSFIVDMADENANPEEHLTDELDFYDFLEVVSDKIDEFTQRGRDQSNILSVSSSSWEF